MRLQNTAIQGKAALIAAGISCLTIVAGTGMSITGTSLSARESDHETIHSGAQQQQAHAYAAAVAPAIPHEQTTAYIAEGEPVDEHQPQASQLLPVVNQPDIRPEHRELADATLKRLPVGCRRSLTSFYVEYNQSPNRGLSGAGGMMILTGLVPDAEFVALLVHECGHIVGLADMAGTPEAGTTSFYDGSEPIFANDPSLGFYRISWTSAKQKKKGMTSSAFVSGYAKTDAFEDFAETFAFYALQRSQFERLSATNPILRAKYEWMARNVFTDASTVLSEGKPRTIASLPWDITKLEY